jgi:spermidine/putrescine transport system substrate-binding protein
MQATQPIGLALALVLAAALSTGAANGTDWTCPDGFRGQTLSVYNWTTYIAEDTIPEFERLCGVRVIYDTYPTDDDMLARLRQGNPGYDVVVPTGATMYLLIAEGLLLPLDHGAIPNLVNVDEDFLDLPFDRGNRYSVPYQWGTMGIGYHVGRVGREIDSWDDLFEHAGPVSWIEDLRGMIGVGLRMLGLDPNTRDAADIALARDYLIARGGNVVYINQDDGQELLLRGEADMVVEYSGDIFQIIDECACDDYAFVIPDEGTLVWVDVVAVPVGARNPALALVFLDYLLDAAVAASISNYTAYGSPNRAAVASGLIDEELLRHPGIYPDDDTRARLFTVEQDPDVEQRYNDAWDEIKIAIGR